MATSTDISSCDGTVGDTVGHEDEYVDRERNSAVLEECWFGHEFLRCTFARKKTR